MDRSIKDLRKIFEEATWLLVIGVSRTSLMVGGFRSKVMLVLLEEETVPSAVRCDNDHQLLCCLIVGRNLNSTPAVPVNVARVKSYVDSLLNSTRLSVPVRVSVNKLNLVPKRIIPGHISVFRNG